MDIVWGGWFADEELTEEYVFTRMPAENITLYAGWEVNEYTIRFHSNGGSDVSDITQEYGTEITAPAEPAKTGCSFAGWYTDKKLTQAFTFATMPASDIVLYAKWDSNEYTITFEGNGSISTPAAIVAAYGEEIAEPDIMTMKKAGCSFGGWYADETLQERYEFDTMPAGNITLYASWKKKSYQIVWTDYDDTVLKNETVLYGENATAPENPTRTGYQFIGWSSDGSSITANEVIVAVYEKINEPVVSSTPEVSEKPGVSSTPEVTEQPNASSTPKASDAPEVSSTPKASDAPDVSSTPEVSNAPNVSSIPVETDEPMVVTSSMPATTDGPMVVASNTPVVTIEPNVTEGAVSTDDTSLATSVPVTAENLSAVTGTSTAANQTTPAATKKVTIKIKATYKVPVKNEKPKTVTKKVKSKITLYLDIKQCRTAKFTAIVSGKKVTAKWSTSNKKIVSVSAKGKIRAKKAGTAYIRVKAGGQTKKIKVVVKKAAFKTEEKEKLHT